MISIVIPTYNRAKVISRVLENLLTQTCQKWQCVIVDDHSSDNTADVVKKYVDLDSRFVYLENNRTKGAQGARNTGILAAQGDWICFFDSDDVMYPNYVERMGAEIDDKSDVIVCKALIRDSKTGEKKGYLDKIHSRNIHQDLLREKCYVAYDVAIIRKEKLLEIGLLDENCPSMQEWDAHIRLSKVARYKTINDVLCEWLIGDADAISTNQVKHDAGMLYIYQKHVHEFRKYAYLHFLRALSNIWPQVNKPYQLLKLAPELLIYIPLRKILNK